MHLMMTDSTVYVAKYHKGEHQVKSVVLSSVDEVCEASVQLLLMLCSS